MNWMFLDAPTDGTVMLVWQPLNKLGTRFASDGYIWADPEQAFSQEHRGYVGRVWFDICKVSKLMDYRARLRRCIFTGADTILHTRQ